MRALKLLLRRYLPTALYHRLKYRGLAPRLDAVLAGTVQAGPFKGMKFAPTRAFNGHYGMLLGVYERDTNYIWTGLALKPGDTVAILGAAEGYYAVGLARLYPGTRILAYELETWIHPILTQIARANGVDPQIQNYGAASVPLLNEHFAQHPPRLVCIDVEGAEQFLADPATVPALATAELVIELHPMVVPDILATIQQRFSATHNQSLISETPRTWADVPPIFSTADEALLKPHLATILSENRVEPMQWLHLVPNRSGNLNMD